MHSVRGLLYASIFIPYLKDWIPTGFVFAVGLTLITVTVVAQWRKPPEFVAFEFQKRTTPNELSPFTECGTEKDLEVSHTDLWTEEEEKEG